MRATVPLLIASLGLAPCSIAFAPQARAEDAPDDTSAAGKAYRDAWWAETAGGNLAHAVELYAKAADAEGPASVRARALYRRAVVLQRIGKTEDAIRTLERLAKDHPGEAALQADAHARLAEWTAVDLKKSFAEWYQRYQYSPEFQAKIVDLVLKLGGYDQARSQAASSELLTIGAPAIPALRQHMDSPNQGLRDQVVTTLLELGDVPSLASMRTTLGWRKSPASWATLRSASAEVRSRLKTEAQADVPLDQGLVAMLDGPAALLTWANKPEASDAADLFLSMAFKNEPMANDAPALRPLLLALVENKSLKRRELALYWLYAIKGVDVARAESWVGGEDPWLRESGLGFLGDPRGGVASWEALRRLLKLAPGWPKDRPKLALVRAVLARIEVAPSGDELDQLADELLADGGAFDMPLSAAARRVLARMVERSPDSRRALALFQNWRQPAKVPDPTDMDRLVDWLRSSPWEDLRERAMRALTATPDGRTRALGLLSDGSLPAATRSSLFVILLNQSQPADLLEQASTRHQLLAFLREQDEARGKEWGASVASFLGFASNATVEARRAIGEEWLADPAAFPRTLLLPNYTNHGFESSWRSTMVSLRPAWRKAWASWTPAQRDAAIEGLGAIQAGADSEMQAFLQACLLDASNGISAASRQAILPYAGPLTLDGLRAAYDLGTAEGTDEAIGSILWGNPKMSFPEATPELFEALKRGLRPDGSAEIARALFEAFRKIPRFQRPLLEALLAHRDEGAQESAVDELTTRESSEDLPLWLVALRLPSASVRAKAAVGMRRIASPDATKALVKALDDPNSGVRNAALASLEAIQKAEDLKRVWREKVR